ncbi:regulatory protein GemA [Zhongshania sp.]|jgi:phage gp16-like protein|uniref:regulatory protein GemA n=1 Tax=Zhongshania sp. TaxID=1971902 RepID=UPI002A821A41|nr:regulatory protein GemA [Zhongshania sp.]
MPSKPTRDRRSRELAQIHMGATKLGLDTRDQDHHSPYRAMLWAVGQVHSAAELDATGRAAVLAHLKKLGFNTAPARPRPAKDSAALLSKIRAQLHAANRDESYGDALAKRICKVERLVWCKPAQLNRIVAALWYDQQRQQKRGAP